METLTENIEINEQIEQKRKFDFDYFASLAWKLTELLLFLGVVLYAVQPLLVLCAKAFSLPFTQYGIFFTSSVISLIAIFVRASIFLCLNFSKTFLKSINKQKIQNFILGKWEIFVLFFALVWTYISCLVAKNQEIVWGGNWYNIEGFWTVLKYGVIFLDAYLLRSQRLKKLFCNLLVVSGTIVGAILIHTNLQGIDFYIHFSRSVYRNSNHYGYALAVSTVMAVGFAIKTKSRSLKVFYLVCFAILHANMLVSDCFGSLIGEVCGIVALFVINLLIKKSKELLYVAISVAVIFVGVTVVLESAKISTILQDFSVLANDAEDIIQGESSGKEGTGRWKLWEDTAQIIIQVPWFGKGLDCYYSNDYVNGTLDMPHNEYLQIASNVGVPVLLMYLVALFGIYFRAFKRKKELSSQSIICFGGSVGYLVSAFFGNTFTYTYPFLLILLAFGMLKNRRN